MSISQIQPDGGINPLKDARVDKFVKNEDSAPKKSEESIQGSDKVELSERGKLLRASLINNSILLE